VMLNQCRSVLFVVSRNTEYEISSRSMCVDLLKIKSSGIVVWINTKWPRSTGSAIGKVREEVAEPCTIASTFGRTDMLKRNCRLSMRILLPRGRFSFMLQKSRKVSGWVNQ